MGANAGDRKRHNGPEFPGLAPKGVGNFDNVMLEPPERGR